MQPRSSTSATYLQFKSVFQRSLHLYELYAQRAKYWDMKTMHPFLDILKNRKLFIYTKKRRCFIVAHK